MATAPAPDQPTIRKAPMILGHSLRLRDADVEDAAFILGLRMDPAKNRHLSATPPSLAAQRDWLRSYGAGSGQAYFVIETAGGAPIGTVRLYDARGPSFAWGSWILVDDRPARAAAESMAMVYLYAMSLGFTAAHFEVRRGNEKVWGFHERLGAQRVDADDLEYRYVLDHAAMLAIVERYRALLPGGIKLQH